MRSSLSSLVAVLVLSAAFAGCLGSGSEDDAAAKKAEADALDAQRQAALANVTNDDGSGLNESVEAGEAGRMPHQHDYWSGKERETLMDQDINVDAPTAMAFTFFNVFRGTPGTGGAQFRLPDGKIVYEGTGKLELTATWTDATVTGMGVRYRTAASPEFSEPKELKSGMALVVDVAPEMSDPPHEKTSRWQFLITPAQAGQSIVGKFHVKVDIVKMRDIDLFPGHPIFYAGDVHTLPVFKGSATSTQASFVTEIANRATDQQTDDGVKAMHVVAPETKSMTANLTVKTVGVDIGTATKIDLLVQTADRSFYVTAKLIGSDPAKQLYQYAWLIDTRMADSPYAKASNWKFDVRVSSDPTGQGDSQCGGCSNAKVDYELEVVQYDAEVDGATALARPGRGGG